MPKTYDIAEIAAIDRQQVLDEAAAAMPEFIQLEVLDGRYQFTRGYVICNKEGRRVRCVVPSNINLSNANGTSIQYVVWALPLNGRKRAAEYIAVGLAWDGTTNSRIAGMSATSVTIPTGSAPSTPSGGTTLYATNSGQIAARAANGTDTVMADDTVAWLSMIG